MSTLLTQNTLETIALIESTFHYQKHARMEYEITTGNGWGPCHYQSRTSLIAFMQRYADRSISIRISEITSTDITNMMITTTKVKGEWVVIA